MINRIPLPSLLFVSFLGVANGFSPIPRVASTRTPISTTTSTSLNSASVALPQISNQQLQELAEKDYVVIPNFLSKDLQQALRQDVSMLRDNGNFKVAKIGQDATSTLNQNIRVAETCFIGGKRSIPDHPARDQMIQVLQNTCRQLSSNSVLNSCKLDSNLSELLYAYYPQGGFYRRHRDAIPGSASVLRTYSLLLYLNEDWTESDAGQLRIHLDGGGDECPQNKPPNYVDVEPQGGTLVLFDSTKIPHEVLDTNSERLAIVGWFNRELTAADIQELGGVDPFRMGMLAVSAGLVTVGLFNLLS